MLKICQINTFYGKMRALWDLSMKIEKGEIVALIGANGAGKTTVLNTISGLICPVSGTIEFLGRGIEGLLPYRVAQQGICYVPEGGKPFPEMTVRENLEMGAYIGERWENKKETLNQVYQVFPILRDRADQLARTLSGGERQMLAIGRALMSKPKLCMFDEPSYGLSPLLVKGLFNIIKTLREQGLTILLVEQNVRQALEIANRAYVLENGRGVLEGESEKLLQEDHIKRAYLGL
jgi:branched-chain amino acid transport system ATP-binding protein